MRGYDIYAAGAALMLFPTFAFLVFFAVTVALLAPVEHAHRARKAVLLVASYYFYAQWNWTFCFLLAGSSAVTYAAGLLIARWPRRLARRGAGGGDHGAPRRAVRLQVRRLPDRRGQRGAARGRRRMELPFLGLILPVGISFFTFHGISYVVDVWRGDVAVCRRLDDMLLYLSFFPQLIAGPIVRASFFLPQLYAPQPARLPLAPPLLLILGGLFKKAIVANYLATELVDPVFFDPASFSSLDLLIAAYGYAVQIYCDFSGYTDMAIGLAALLGYYFPPNFAQPYRSSSFQEFWRRWHISLSFWLRDYLYKPLGGSRHGQARTVFALMTTMLLGGLWHGANWKFLLWGGIHGGALVIERAVRPFVPRALTGRVGTVLGTLLVFHVVCVAWVLFRADTMQTAVIYGQTFWQSGSLTVQQARPATVALVALGLLLQFLPADWTTRLARRAMVAPDWAQAAVASVLIVGLDAMGPDGVAPFIYFQF